MASSWILSSSGEIGGQISTDIVDAGRRRQPHFKRPFGAYGGDRELLVWRFGDYGM